MGVLIENRQCSIKIPLETIRQTTQAILSALDCPDGELSLVLVDDAQIAALNEAYLNRTGATNVISFPMKEGDFADISPDLLGDVVISVETAAREGDDAGLSLEERFNALLVHGILHLFGYDHVHDPEEAHRMEKKSEELLGLIPCRW